MKPEPVFTRADMRRALDAALDALRPERDGGRTFSLSCQQAHRAHQALADVRDHACYRCFPRTAIAYGFVCLRHQLEDFLAEAELTPREDQ